MTYGRKPKYRESDYSQYITSCILAFPKNDEHTNSEKRKICSETYFSGGIKTKNRRVSKRYPVKMKRK